MRKHVHHEKNSGSSNIRDIILGGQDGIVNILGTILAVAMATQDAKIVIIAGLASTFAESISMAAVAYTSTKAVTDYYKGQLKKEKREIDKMPGMERQEIYRLYRRKGFSGPILDAIVKKVTSNKKIWLRTMMEEELHLFKDGESPGRASIVVGLASLLGSLVPLISFFFMDVGSAIVLSLVFSVIVLFATGAIKNYLTIGKPLRGGIEIAAIGITAAIIGYLIGAALGTVLYV